MIWVLDQKGWRNVTDMAKLCSTLRAACVQQNPLKNCEFFLNVVRKFCSLWNVLHFSPPRINNAALWTFQMKDERIRQQFNVLGMIIVTVSIIADIHTVPGTRRVQWKPFEMVSNDDLSFSQIVTHWGINLITLN